jgi:hypothetical protein
MTHQLWPSSPTPASESDPVYIPLTMLRIWEFLTGLGPELEQRWQSFLTWPPDVFALCASVLKRSGCYPLAMKHLSGNDEVTLRVDSWLNFFEHTPSPANSFASADTFLKDDWAKIWSFRNHHLSRITEHVEWIRCLLRMITVADQASKGSGLPIQDRAISSGQYNIMSHGWKLLAPTRYGSSLCTQRIHPNAVRVLPKMHVPKSGLTLRSFSHHLALCESDEVQPRWFMIPGARGEIANRDHINLLLLPWPFTIHPAQFERATRTEQHEAYFDYRLLPSSEIANIVTGLCDEAETVLGSLDGVVMPELALTPSQYEVVRNSVLARKLLFVTGVGGESTKGSIGRNQVYIDVPLSKHHAVHFRQSKHHRWRLSGEEIAMYGIGGRLDPSRSYWENIDIEDRRLLFLVLRPWLVTSVLICEDLARHDPVGELVRGVGPHLVMALLMDGPQLASRWSSRYAATLADDPGSSVISTSSLGMVGLSRPEATTNLSRTVALWKDSREGAKELPVPLDADALAITISLDYSTREYTADGRSEESARPVLTGVNPIRRRRASSGCDIEQVSKVKFLSPNAAVDLARLVQQQNQFDRSPELLVELTGEAKTIGWEVWRLMAGYPSQEQVNQAREQPDDYARLPEKWHTETALEICRWHITNMEACGVPTSELDFPQWWKDKAASTASFVAQLESR